MVQTRRYKSQLSSPEQRAAYDAVQYAIRKGRLIPQPCEVCGASPVNAHHDDYSRKLDVRWLCPTHHARHHHGVPEERAPYVVSKYDLTKTKWYRRKAALMPTIMHLREQGMTLRQISAVTSVPVMTLSRWLRQPALATKRSTTRVDAAPSTTEREPMR